MNLGKMQAGSIMLVGYALRALSPPYTYTTLSSPCTTDLWVRIILHLVYPDKLPIGIG